MLDARLKMTLSLFLLALGRTWALDTTLTWVVGRETITFSESVSATSQGYSATIRSSVGESDSLTLDSRRSTLEWRRSVPGERTEIVAARTGGAVRILGSYKGKPYDRTIDMGDLPWYQFQEISYERFHETQAEGGTFWTIDRKTLKPTLFRMERRETVEIASMGRKTRAVTFDLHISGLPSFLFQARFWLRESDGRFLRLDVPPILGLPRSVVELSAES